jgi:tetratricopeptide repeat protein
MASEERTRRPIIDQQRVDAHVELGQALLALGSRDVAIAAFRDALTLSPWDISAARHLVCALESSNEPQGVDAWLVLGAALARQDRYHEAAVVYREALARKPDALRAHVGLGRVLLETGEPELAIESFERALTLAPDFAFAHTQLGRAYHLVGELERSWQEFKWFYERPAIHARDFEQPLWDGSSLRHRTILIWTDEALGDSIQALRYVQRLKTPDTRIVLECNNPRLLPLVEQMAGVDQIVMRGAPLPPFDIHVPVFLIASLLPLSEVCLPTDVPYLSVGGGLVEKWRHRLLGDDGLDNRRVITVGLSWSGNPTNIAAHFRFTTLASFAPLANMRGVRFICLQMGPRAIETLAPPPGLAIEVPQHDSCSLADTAALMMNLDLVITVDTMVAHLAGALGRPVWVVLPHVADFRWLRGTDSSPWYPTMRLFRQARPGDWLELVGRARLALQEVVDARLLAEISSSAVDTHSNTPVQSPARA